MCGEISYHIGWSVLFQRKWPLVILVVQLAKNISWLWLYSICMAAGVISIHWRFKTLSELSWTNTFQYKLYWKVCCGAVGQTRLNWNSLTSEKMRGAFQYKMYSGLFSKRLIKCEVGRFQCGWTRMLRICGSKSRIRKNYRYFRSKHQNQVRALRLGVLRGCRAISPAHGIFSRSQASLPLRMAFFREGSEAGGNCGGKLCCRFNSVQIALAAHSGW